MHRSAWKGCLGLSLVFSLCRLPAQANIGDDLSRLRQAYGSAKAVGGQMLFQHEGYSISVYFDGEHSAMEIFVVDGSKKDKTDITQADIDAILAAEDQGQAWNAVQTHSGQPTWLSADHKLIARFNPGEKILTIMLNAN